MPHPPRTLTHNGETLTLKEWAVRLKMHPETIRCRIDHLGWSVSDALTSSPDRRFVPTGGQPLNSPRPCPRLKHHRASGQARCRWQSEGQAHYRYFGVWGSQEASAAYRRFQLEWATGANSDLLRPGVPVHIAELVLRYLEHVDGYYVKNGKWTSERTKQRIACRVLVSLYPAYHASEFTPDCLRACQQEMLSKGWVRNSINQHTWRIVRCFEWGVGRSMVPPDVHLRLKAVDYLQAGRTTAPDMPPIKPVPEDGLEPVVKLLHKDEGRRAVLESMIRFHAVTGMRPGELCAMALEHIDRSGEVWRYTVPAHINKNAHRDKIQRYWIGPKGQAIISPYLTGIDPKTLVWRFPAKVPGGKRTAVSRCAYAEFVKLACDRAGVARWHPHQLRHTRATEVQRRYEDDSAAAAAIGDTVDVAREVYVDPADAVRRRIAKEMG